MTDMTTGDGTGMLPEIVELTEEPDANAKAAKATIERVIERYRFTRALAERLYGVPRCPE